MNPLEKLLSSDRKDRQAVNYFQTPLSQMLALKGCFIGPCCATKPSDSDGIVWNLENGRTNEAQTRVHRG